MKELVEESDGGNTKKHIAIQLSEWIKKDMKLQKQSYRLQFIDSASLLILNNLLAGILKAKCKYGYEDKNMQLAKINTTISTAFLNIKT